MTGAASKPQRKLPPVAMLLLLVSFAVGSARAHQVPSITVEADFARNRSFTLRINVDPRLVLSDEPTTLAPVPGAWYEERSADEVAKIHEDTVAYLRRNLELVFGPETMTVPSLKVVPIDGAESKPLKPETAELHLLATGQAVLPESANSFAVRLGREANSSLILLNKVEGGGEPSLRVIFPGEVSQEFPLTGVRTLDELLGQTGNRKEVAKDVLSWIYRGVLVLLLLVAWLIFRNKWKTPARRK